MSEKGIDYVAQKSMKKDVTGINDLPALKGVTICLDNRGSNQNVINVREKHKAARTNRHHKWSELSTRKFRKLNEKVKKKAIKYEQMCPIASLWEQYAERLPGTEQSVAKMDLHGAEVTVVSSPDPTLIGVKGRILKESYGAIIIVSEDDTVRQINKNHTLISLKTPKGNFEINMTAIRCHPYLKASKRWKQRTPISLPY